MVAEVNQIVILGNRLSKRIETELEWLIFFFTHWVQASEVFLFLSNPHGCNRWVHHRTSYGTLKKEMRVEI
jgi:hypothetical protein